MSKTAEERITELQQKMEDMQGENTKLQNYYSQAYKAMEEAKQNESYLKGQVEMLQSSGGERQSDSDGYTDFSGNEENGSVQKMLEKMVNERLEPRM